jgi:hypothetical protein
MKQKQEALAQRVALNFSPKPWKHEMNVKGDGWCYRCQQRMAASSPCPIPDSVDITDRGKAMEIMRSLPDNEIFEPLIDWARQHCEKGEYPIVPVNVMLLIAKGIAFEKATAEDLFEMCCQAKENSNE